jgi:glycosyltransferase involved in cell wall biosynthesis
MRHYLPPGERPVSAVLGFRALEPAEDLTATLELADVVVAADPSTAAACREGRAEAQLLTFADLLATDGGPTGAEGAAAEPFVVGVGPGDWRGAPDLFVRAADHLRHRPGRSSARFGWIGLDPDDDRSFPYRFDATRLDLDGAITWTDRPAAAVDLLRRADVLVLTARSAFPLPIHPWVTTLEPARFLGAIGTPVVGFATPAVVDLAGTAVATVPYVDTEALAAAIDAAIDRSVPSRVPQLLDEVLATLAVGGRR